MTEIVATEGLGGIACFDQQHSEAMCALRKADAFVLLTYDDDGEGTLHAVAKWGGVELMAMMLSQACEATGDMVGELSAWAESCEDAEA